MWLMKKLSGICATGILSALILVISNCQPLVGPVEEQPTIAPPDTRFDRTIGIIVNKELYPRVKPSLDIYAADLAAIEGKRVWIIGTTFDKNSSMFELHDSLATRYESGDLEGAVLIGDLPAAQYEFRKDLSGTGYASFLIEIYFMDLDGIWYDTARAGDWAGKAQTGVFDGRSGNIDAEIWVSRIAAFTMNGREEDIIKSYFERVHNRMTGNDTMPERAVLFYDPWAASETVVNPPYNICDIFTDVTYFDRQFPLDTKENWIAALRKGYEYAVVSEHGSYDLNQFNGENFSISDYNKMPTEHGGPSNVRFYNLVSCNNGIFTGPNIGTCYALGHKGLLSICSTKPGGMVHGYDLNTALSNGESFGSAFKKWYNRYINNNNFASEFDFRAGWSYGMAIMGAGTLKLHRYSTGKTHQIIITQNTGGTLNRTGRIMITDGDSTTIEIRPEHRYQIEYVVVDGDTVIRKKYPKFPYVVSYGTLDTAGRTIPVSTSYTFRNVHANHRLDVVFSQRKEFRVAITTLSGGFINNPPVGKPDTSCHAWNGLFYEGDIFTYSVGTLFSLKQGGSFGRTYRWSFDSSDLAKAISMVSDNGSLIPGAIGRNSYSDTVQVFRDHYIVAAFEPKKVYSVTVTDEGYSFNTGGSFLVETGDRIIRGPDCTILPSGDCTTITGDSLGYTCLVREGEAMTFQTQTIHNITLVDVLVDGVSAGQQAIICRRPLAGTNPGEGEEECYVRFSRVDASYAITFVFKPIAAP